MAGQLFGWRKRSSMTNEQVALLAGLILVLFGWKHSTGFKRLSPGQIFKYAEIFLKWLTTGEKPPEDE